jgi:hypothetical protein
LAKWGFIADLFRVIREGVSLLRDFRLSTQLLASKGAEKSFNLARDNDTLLAVLDIYHSHMTQLLSLSADKVRVNLMLLVKTEHGYGLRICLTNSKGSYSEQERRLIWDKGKGCCGRVWEEKTPLFADNQKWLKAEALPKEHAEATRNVHWVASLPIWDQRKQKFWGVLNADTLVPLSSFPSENWLEIAALYMRLLTHLCSSLRLFSMRD